MKTFLVLMAMIASPGMAYAGKPCDEAYVLIDGKLFEYDVFAKPGFDPKTAPTAAMCDADAVPVSVMEDLLKDSSALTLAKAHLDAEKVGRAADREAFEKELAATNRFITVLKDVKTPAPKEDDSWSFEAGVITGGLIATVVGVLLAVL